MPSPHVSLEEQVLPAVRADYGGTLLGAVIMGIITNGMNLLSISTNWQYVMQGVIIIIAVGLDRIKSND